MCTGRGSNQGPIGPKSDALTTAALRHLTCLVQILIFIDQLTWLDFKLIDERDNLSLDKILRINVTHETAGPFGFAWLRA